jgi:lipid II:glycine glycyltransferase (peptidoglycan interpeptide bridge formation enzyme)
LKLSKNSPHLSRVIGLFSGEDASPEKMEAFLWVCNHGDHVEYRAAGSARQTDSRIPYGYLLAWEMIRWAKAEGAEWFDMGGVTLAEGDEPELEGISRFKRYFSRDVVEVGAEWVLEPLPMRARIATLVSYGALSLRNLMEKRAYRKQLLNS